MSVGCRKLGARSSLRAGVALLLVELLILPPNLSATSIQWQGGPGMGNYSHAASWVCSPTPCTPPTFPNNNLALGLTFDAFINIGGGEIVNFDGAASGSVVNSMTIGGGTGSSTLNIVGPNTLTFGTPSVTTGNVLTVSNGGILNINSGGNAVADLSGGAGALNDTGGQINITGGGTLTLQNNTPNANSTLIDNGNISVVGTSTAAKLVLSAAPPAGATFTLSGTGTLTLGGMGQLADHNGVESLVNDVNHTIAGDGTISVQANIANLGTLHASTPGASLIVNSNNLTNWNGGTSTLTGGSWIVDSGASLKLSSLGTGQIQTISGASITLSGSGLLTNGSGVSALSGLTTNNGTLALLNGANLSLTALTNVLGGTLSGGNFEVGVGSTLSYVGGDITTIAQGASVTLDGNGKLMSNSGNSDALSSTLTAVGGTLALRNGANLTLAMPFTNVAANGALIGGTFVVGDNSSLNYTGVGIQTISAANLTLEGSGKVTNAGAGSNALTNLSTLSAGVDGNAASLTLDHGANLTLGAFTNSVATDALPNSSTLTIQGGSTLTTGAFTNLSTVSGNLQSANANVNVADGSTLNVDSLTTSTNNGFSSSNITVDASFLNVANSVTQGLNGPGPSSGGDTLTLQNGAMAHVGGNFTNENNLNASIVNVNNSHLSVDGAFTQMQSQAAFGQSQLNLTNNSTVTLGGLTNSSLTFGNGQAQSLVSVDSGSTLSIKGAGAFTNISNLGLLSGGGYFVGQDSTLNYSGANITAIDANTTLTLSANGAIKNNGADAIGNSLITNNGTLVLTGGANLTLPTLTNVAAGVLSGGNFEIGDMSTLTYGSTMVNGGDITTIGQTASLTFDGSGKLFSAGSANPDALSNTLTTINGALTLQNGASLTLSQNLTNVTPGGVLTAGTITVGNGAATQSTLRYRGVDINTIGPDANLTLGGNGSLISSAGVNPDAISNTLTTINGAFTAQNGANLTLATPALAVAAADATDAPNSTLNVSSATVTAMDLNNSATSSIGFSSTSTVSVMNNGTLTVNNLTNTATNTGSAGTALAQVLLTGASILNVNANLTNSSVNSGLGGTATATISLDGNSALNVTGTYNNTSASLALTNGSTATVGGLFTNDANSMVTLDAQPNGGCCSTLTTNGGFSNSGTVSLGNGSTLMNTGAFMNTSADTPLVDGNAMLSLDLVSTGTITGDLTNSATVTNGNTASSTVSLTNFSMLSVNNLTNSATNNSGGIIVGAGAGSPSPGQGLTTRIGVGGGDAEAQISLSGLSTLAVAGNLSNISTNTAFLGTANAAISLDEGSTLTVGGTFTNTAASLTLDNGSMATVSGSFTNDINSTVSLDACCDGGSILTTQSGFSNAGVVSLGFLSTVTNTGTFTNSGSVSLFGGSTLTSTLNFDNTNGTLSLNGGGNTVLAAGFTNTGGTLSVAAGDTADFRTGGLDTFTNLSNGTLNGGAYNIGGAFDFDASAGTGAGQFQTLSGASVTINGTGQILYGGPGNQLDALAAVTNLSLSTLAFNDAGPHTITPVASGGISTLTLTDSTLNLSSTDIATQTSLTVAGNLANTSNMGNGAVNLTGSNLTVDGTVTNTSNGSFTSSINLNSANLNNDGVSVLTGSTLTATGALINSVGSSVNLNGGGNMLIATGLTNNGSIAIGQGDTMDVRNAGSGVLTNLDATGTLNNAGPAFNRSSYSIAGQLFYDTGTGGSTLIKALNGVDLTLTGSGALLYGAGNDALPNLATLTGSSLTLDGQTRTISPTGLNPVFALNSSSSLTLQNGASLTLNALVSNDTSSSISLAGSGNMLFGRGFTNGIATANGGLLNVDGGSVADFRTGGTDTFTNLSGGVLSGGSYDIGGTFNFDASAGAGGGQFRTINNAAITINQSGQILYGAGMTQGDALAAVTNMNGSSLTFNDVTTKTIAPVAVAGTSTLTLANSSLNLNSTTLATQTSLSVDGSLVANAQSGFSSVNLSGSNLTVDGTVTTTGGTFATVNLNSAGLFNGVTTITTGSTLTATGALINGAGSGVNLNGGGNTLIANGLTNNGAIAIGLGSTMDVSNGGTGVLTNLTGSTLTNGGSGSGNSAYDISGQLKFGVGTDGSTQITALNGVNLTLRGTGALLNGAGNDALPNLNSLTNSSLTLDNQNRSFNVGAAFTLDPSSLVLNGSALSLNGAIDNNAGSSITLSNSNGVSSLTATGALFNDMGSTVTLNGGGNTLTAQGLTNNGTITIQQGDTADFRTGSADKFTNLANGTLSGGSYYVAGTFKFDPTSNATTTGNINKIATMTTLTLDGSGAAAVLYGPSGTDALGALTDIAGTFNLGYSGTTNTLTKSFTPTTGTLSVESTGQFNLGNSFGSGVANITGSLANAGSMTLENLSGITTTTGTTNTGTLSAFGSDFIRGPSFSNTGTLYAGSGGNGFLDIRNGGANTFSNLDGTSGTLGGGGTFNVGGSFLFDPTSGTTGGNINVIGTGTTLDLSSSVSQVRYGAGSGVDAIASLTEVTGTLTLENGASHKFIPTTGTFTVDGAGTVNLGSGSNTASITGAMQNNGTVNLSGNSILNVSQGLTNAGTVTQSNGSATTVNVTGALSNSATGTYTVGYGSVTNALSVDNAVGGVINVNGGFNTGGSLRASLGVDNAGTLNVNAPFGGQTGGGIVTAAGAPFVNESTGAITIGAAASVTAPGFTNSGSLSVMAGGTANFQGGAFTNLSGGTLTGGTYTIGGTFLFDAGSGVINNIAAGTSLTLDAQNLGVPMVLSGSANALKNLTGNAGNFTLTNAAGFSTTPNGGTFTNSGILATLGSGGNAFAVTGIFANTGTVNLSGAGDILTATGLLNNGGLLNLNGSNASIMAAEFDNQAGGMGVTFAGNQKIASTGLASNEGAIMFNGAGGTLSSGGDFTNTGALTTAIGSSGNAVNVTGNIFNTSPGMVNLKGTGDQLTATGQFNNSGTVTITGNNETISSTDFSNMASGILTVDGTGDSLASSLTDAGTVTIAGGAALSIGANTLSQTGGITTVDAGGSLTAGLVDLTGGTLAGGGTIAGNLTNNGGTIHPGNPTQTITVTGNYDQTVAGILMLDLAGPLASPTSDHLTVNGNATLGGTLNLNLDAGFDAAVGTIFNIVSWGGTEMGDFNVFNDQTFDNGTRTFEELITGNHVELDVMSVVVGPPAAPEPSTVSMLLVFMLGAGVTWTVRRRRRNILNPANHEG